MKARLPNLTCPWVAAGALAAAFLLLPGWSAPVGQASVGLLGHWAADGNADDSSGNGHHGTLMHGAGFGPGVDGQAFDLDGHNDFVALGSTLGNGAAALTVEAWVKPRAFPGPGVVGLSDYIVSADDAGSFADHSLFSLNLNQHGPVTWLPSSMTGVSVSFGVRAVGQTEVHAALGHPDVYYYASYWWGVAIAPNPPEIALNQWAHLVGVYDGSETRLYINGRLAATSSSQPDGANRSVSGPLVTTPLPRRIGRPGYDADPTYGSFNGLVDGVRIYARALDACEIGDLAGHPCEPPPEDVCVGVADGLVSCWAAEGNANDMVGVNHGTLHNGVGFAPGVSGQAFSFDGVNDFVRVLDSPTLDLTSHITLAAWVKATPDAVNGNTESGGILGKVVPVAAGWTAPYQAYNLFYFGTEDAPAFYMGYGGGTAYTALGTPLGSVPPSEWHHVAGTYDGSAMRTYIDGHLVNTKPLTGPITATNGHLYFGTQREDRLIATETFKGLLDELRIYSRALDECEIRELAHDPCVPADTEPPVISLVDLPPQEATSAAGAIVAYGVSAFDEVDGDVTPECAPASGTPFALGATEVICTAEDAAGNTAHLEFVVLVQDTTPPAVTVPVEASEEATSPSGAAVGFSASAHDVVDGPVEPGCSPSSGATFPLGSTTVACSATDNAGNTSPPATFPVIVHDTTPPSLSVPGDIAAVATGGSGAVVGFTASATDIADSDPVVTCVPPSGSTFPIGTTTVTCTALDDAGLSAGGGFSVNVVVTTETIEGLLRRWITNRGIINSLMVKLRNGAYGAFRNEVSALTGKWLTPAQAAELLLLVSHL
ncbi:MAG: HYR domain-containing protein [Acidimicrobiia bacterium]|nr:HYR domain-containing protein [Acidimicrobiia bacterium]